MPVPDSDYVLISSNPELSGDFKSHGGYVVNLGMQFQSNLTKVPTLTGAKGVPDIPKGQIAVSIMVPPTGLETPVGLAYLDCPVMVYINGTYYDNAFHAGGTIQTREFGEGPHTLIVTKLYTVLGLCTTAT